MTRLSQWNWGGEYSQISAINELDDELAAERSARYRQARQLAQAQDAFNKTLKQVDSKLESVSDRIEAVLDWTELRFQQVEFDEYQARKEIRNTVRALAEGRPARIPGFADVPGYWLPAAAAAVLPLVLRERPAVPSQRTAAHPLTDLKTGLEAARERDAVRAELFNLAVGRCFDQPVFIDAAVLRLLSEPADLGVAGPGSVAAGWRTLWEHAALGAFGPGAADQLEGFLCERFDPTALDEDERSAWDRAIEDFGHTDGVRLPKDEQFAALQAHFAQAAVASPLDGVPQDGDAHDDQVWRRYLQELIEEPSPAELPLVTEMESLGLESEGPHASRPSWTEPVGTVAALLRRDLLDPEAPVALRRLALDLTAPLLRSRLDHLESELHPAETAVVTLRRRGASIDVTKDGHDPDDLAEIERRIGLAFPNPGPSTAATATLAGALGAVAVLTLVLGQWIVALPFALAVLIPLWKHRGEREKAAKERVRHDEQLADLRAALGRAGKDAERQEREATEHDAAVRRALEHLRESLPAEARPTGLTESV